MYFIIGVLIIFYIIWIWKSTSELEKPVIRVSFVAIGTLAITVLTLILFQISKIGVNYPKIEMVGQVRRIILLVFAPINGFIVLTQIANVFAEVKNGTISQEKLQKKIKILLIIFLVLIVFECIYLKSIQNDIITIIKFKN